MEWKYSEDKKHIIIGIPKMRNRITGHRFASVLGLNEYQTPFGAWCEITKLVKLPFKDNKYTIAGKIIETKLIDLVRKKFPNVMSIKEYYGASLDKYKWNNFVEDSNIFGGVMDAVATKEDLKTLTMIVECKTSSKPHLWENNQVPIEYLLQGCEYSYLKGLDRVLFVCAFLQDMDYARPENFVPTEENTIMVVKKLKDVVVEMPDKSLITFDEAIEYCENWWKEYIETGISPEFDEEKDKAYLDIIRTSNPSNDNDLDDLCKSAKLLENDILKLKEEIDLDSKEKELKIIKEAIKNKMMSMLKVGETKISYMQYKLNGTIKIKLDEKLLKEKYPTAYDRCVKQTTTFTLTKSTKEEDDLE